MIKERSCGCIIIEDGKVILVQETEGHWGFPKGHVEKGETDIETAKREIREEINLEVEIDENKKYELNYMTPKGNEKTVILFMAHISGGIFKAQETEVKNAKWFPLDEALETLTHDSAKNVFKKILEDYKK